MLSLAKRIPRVNTSEVIWAKQSLTFAVRKKSSLHKTARELLVSMIKRQSEKFHMKITQNGLRSKLQQIKHLPNVESSRAQMELKLRVTLPLQRRERLRSNSTTPRDLLLILGKP